MKSKAKQGKHFYLLNRCRHFCRLGENRSHRWDNAVFLTAFLGAFLTKIKPSEGDQSGKVNCNCEGKAQPAAVVKVVTTVAISTPRRVILLSIPCLGS